MKNQIATLIAAGLFLGLVTVGQAGEIVSSELRQFIPGSCYLDGRISPPKKSLRNMDGFEVPLVVMWIPLVKNEKYHYRGDAKFRVHNFRIGTGRLIEAYIVDVFLNRDDPGLSEEERHNRFIYKCEGASGNCTASLATVKAAITKQIARDYGTEPENVIYESDARVNFLGVYVKGMTPFGIGAGHKTGQINMHTEVCGTYEYETTLAEAQIDY